VGIHFLVHSHATHILLVTSCTICHRKSHSVFVRIDLSNLCTCVNFVATTVSFSKSNYDVNENDGVVKLTVVLSNPLSIDITISIITIDIEATGKGLMHLNAHHFSATHTPSISKKLTYGFCFRYGLP